MCCFHKHFHDRFSWILLSKTRIKDLDHLICNLCAKIKEELKLFKFYVLSSLVIQLFLDRLENVIFQGISVKLKQRDYLRYVSDLLRDRISILISCSMRQLDCFNPLLCYKSCRSKEFIFLFSNVKNKLVSVIAKSFYR